MPSSAISAEFRPLLKLAIPLVLGELGWMTMGIVDTMMTGRLSKEAMGAVSVGGILFYAVAVFGMGLMYGLDALVSQAFGARRIQDCHHSLINAVYLAVGVTPPLMALQWMLVPLMGRFGIHADVLREAGPYLYAITWSTLPLMLYSAFRRYLQSMDLVQAVMFSLISANLVNAFVNWLLIFGNWGLPEMRAAGAGWATTISRVYMAGVMIAYAIWHSRKYKTGLLAARIEPDGKRMREILSLGLPAASQIVLEVGVFAVATTMIGKLDPVWLAAHQVALSAASYSFMIPLGLGSAAAVRVGQAIGAGRPQSARNAGWAAIVLGVAFMGCAGVLFLMVPRAIGRVFTTDVGVIEAGVVLLALAAVFQLFDGAQGVTTGALRGAGNTRIAAIAHFTGYWIIGLPMGYLLCFNAGWGAAGLWAGLSLALIVIGIVLIGVWSRVQLAQAAALR